MITTLLTPFLLMALCVAFHAIGVMGALRVFDRPSALNDPRFWRPTWLLIRIASWLVLMHLFEIALWALHYAWGHALPDMYTALYFSSVTYTTVGYGDVVPPEGWRLAGGIEALTGILMCGWSTSFFFAVVSRIITHGRRPLLPQISLLHENRHDDRNIGHHALMPHSL